MNQPKSSVNIKLPTKALLFEIFNFVRNYRVFIVLSLSILLVIISYVWFISFGLWNRWPIISMGDTYYAQLAAAFRHGSLSLEARPNPALLALKNPYEPNSRKNIPYIIDASLYKDNYYLYFGPVPALLLVVFGFLKPGLMNDNILAFVFTSGLFLIQSLLIIKIWLRFFEKISPWIISICILLGGLASPFPWILTQARVYEVAEAAGQFFLLMGLYATILAIDQKTTSNGFFLVAGIAWALAIGSRFIQIVPIAFLVILALIWIFRVYPLSKWPLKAMLSFSLLCFPVFGSLIGLGWYNWARFDSIFETGFYYELAGPFLQKYYPVLFSPRYLLPNLWNYLVASPKINATFPFIHPTLGAGAFILNLAQVPTVYHVVEITGVFFTIPFSMFSLMSPSLFIQGAKTGNDYDGFDHETNLFKWLTLGLLGSFLFGFVSIIMYFWVVTRFMIEFTPSLVLLSMVGFYHGYTFINHKPALRAFYTAAGIIAMFLSIVVSILLALSAHAQQFQHFNPVLWNYLTSLFTQ